MKKIIYITVILFLSMSFVYSQWQQINPYPTAYSLNFICFPNAMTGYAVGEVGVITKTTNGGLNWILLPFLTTDYLYSVSFKDANNGMTAGENGTIFRTSDGGNTWDSIKFMPGSIYFIQVSYLSNNICLATGHNWNSIPDTNIIARSTNSGLNWSKSYMYGDTFNFALEKFYFLNQNTGYIDAGYNDGNEVWLVKTTDQGISWNTKIIQSTNYFSGITFLDNNTGFLVGASNVMNKTTDGGFNWDLLTYDGNPSGTVNIRFLNQGTGIITGYNLIRTTNSGINWSKIDSVNVTGVGDVCFSDNTNVTAIGYNEIKYYHSTNSGLNWTAQNYTQFPSLTSTFYGCVMVNSSTGFIGNYNSAVYKTTNGGYNWDSVHNVFAQRFYFVDANTGMTVSMAGYAIYRTTDGGVSWADKSTFQNKDIYYDLKFINGQTGIVAGVYDTNPFNSVMCFTSNGGNNWQRFYPPSNGACKVCEMLDSNTWFIGADNIYKTTNRGINWVKLTNNPQDYTYYTALRFFNNNIAYLSGFTSSPTYSGWMMKTTNGGNNWFSVYSDPSYYPTSIHIFNMNNLTATVYAYGNTYNNGKIIKSSDGGQNWFTQFSTNCLGLFSISFADSSNGLACGDRGAIIRTGSGGTPVYSISGQVSFQDNNQPVNNGSVKAVKLDRATNQIITLDSIGIQSNGSYSLQHVPKDSTYIMAFEDDEALLQYVPTYYPSATNWQNATILYPTGNLNNINVLVYRINGAGGLYHIGGHVYLNSQVPLTGLSGAILYAKVGNNFKSYSISSSAGSYQIDSLSAGLFFIKVDRIGYTPLKRYVNINAFSKDTIDFIFNPSGIELNGSEIPKNYSLLQNYPNPFNPTTTIKFGIPKTSLVKIIIYDILGREVTTIINEQLHAGYYSVSWDAGKYASGVYFYKMESSDFVQTKKLVVLK